MKEARQEYTAARPSISDSHIRAMQRRGKPTPLSGVGHGGAASPGSTPGSVAASMGRTPLTGAQKGITVRSLLGVPPNSTTSSAGVGGGSGSVSGSPAGGSVPGAGAGAGAGSNARSRPTHSAVGRVAAEQEWTGRRPSDIERRHREIESDVMRTHGTGRVGTPPGSFSTPGVRNGRGPRSAGSASGGAGSGGGRGGSPHQRAPPPPPPPEAGAEATDYPSIKAAIERIKAKANADVARLWDSDGRGHSATPPPVPQAAPASARSPYGTRAAASPAATGAAATPGSAASDDDAARRRSTTNDLMSYVRKYHDGSEPHQVPLPSLARLIADPNTSGDGGVAKQY